MTADHTSPWKDLRRHLSDLADSATRGATGHGKGLAAEMAIINPAYDAAVKIVAQLEARPLLSHEVPGPVNRKPRPRVEQGRPIHG